MSFFLKVRTYCHIGDRWTNCIRQYGIPDGFDLSPISTFAFRLAMRDAWTSIHANSMPSEAIFAGWEFEGWEDGAPVFGPLPDGVINVAGVRGTTSLPTQTCSVVILQTANGSPRRTRGLQYLPFPPTDWLGTGGGITPVGQGQLQDVADDLATTIVDVLGRRFVPSSWRRSTDELYAVAAGRAGKGFGQQRRRGIWWPSDPAPPWF